MTQNQMILQRLRGTNGDGHSIKGKRWASPSTPTSMLDEEGSEATPTTSNSSSAASTCDVVLTRSGLAHAAAAAAAASKQQQPKEAGAAATNVTANANANSVEAARPPVLCHRKSVAISYRGRGVSHSQMPPVIADACPNTPSEEALAIVTLAMFFGCVFCFSFNFFLSRENHG